MLQLPFAGFARLRRSALVAAACLIVAGAMPASAQVTLKLGIAAVNEGLLPLQVAVDQGYLKSEGIAIEWLDFRGGGPAVQAFVGGGVDFCICAADHVLRLYNRGLDARILVGLDGHHSYALVGRSDSPYADVKSLKGKRIGVTSPGSLTDNTVRWAIKQAGLDAQADFELISAGTGAAMRAAIETGQVDAGTVVTTEIPEYLRSGKFKIVTDWRPMEYAALVVIGRQQWVDKNPAQARAFVRAVTKAAHLIQTDSVETARSVKTLYPNYSDVECAGVAATARLRLSPDGSVSEQAFETMQDVVLLSDSSLKRVKKTDVDLQPVLSK